MPSRWFSRLQPSPPYVQMLKRGVMEYLARKPWAVTVRELVREGKESFLKSAFKDAEKVYPRLEAVGIEGEIGNMILAQIIRPSIARGQISQSSLAHLGSIFFGLALGVTSGRSAETSLIVSVFAVSKESWQKFYTRMLFEYWDFVLNRNMEKAMLSFKILYLLAQKKTLTTNQIAEQIGITSMEVSSLIRKSRLQFAYKGRPPIIKVVGRVHSLRGQKSQLLGFEDWALSSWNSFMNERVRKEWNSWKKYRLFRQIWHGKGTAFNG